ncbi:N-acetyltransferase family protein [Primorskyibacter sp. 2E107]|uniref:GNAT family N-acetyltransferase n=1 Tax=Primorskyibacter sp. 2E107 TaxID=3403458 RepID=UPI003AF77F96
MSAAVTLRRARSTDAGKLGAMLSAFIDDTPWMPRLHSRAQDVGFTGLMIERGWVTVAATDTGPCGFLAREGAFVHALYLAPESQGKGIGQTLMTQAKSETDRLELWTFEANTGARRFYERMGFAEAECGDGSANDEGLPDIRYVWPAPLKLGHDNG